ncbi:MAG: hypothetical protein QOJ26_594 [Thermoplasmata archaeon]|nr:hypothetical protein [Thermoplasmata archaeon]
MRRAMPGPADREALLGDMPDAGPWVGLACRLGLKRTIRAWGCRFVVHDPFLSMANAWYIRNGRHERPEATLSLRHLDPSLPVVEVGGGLGVVACVVNATLADRGRHVVVEMDPRAAAVLRRNRDLNHSGFEVVEAAIAYDAGINLSNERGTFHGGTRLAKDGTGPSPGHGTLRQLVEGRGWTRFNLVMDIEGMELEILRNEPDLLRDRVAVLVLELHPGLGAPTQEAANAVRRLEALGLHLVDWMGSSMAFVNDRLVAVSPPAMAVRT